MQSLARLAVALPTFALGVIAASPARADVSAWAFLGGGAVSWKQADAIPPLYQTGAPNAGALLNVGRPSLKPDFGLQGALTFDVGAGTSPNGPFVFGGLFRVMPIIGWGTDLAILGRVATQGYQLGGFGIALDAGGYGRFWGDQSMGFLGEVVLGAPLGFELRLLGSKGTGDAVAFGAIAGIDVLRLTLFRHVLLDWWQNPSPVLRSNEAATSPGFHF